MTPNEDLAALLAEYALDITVGDDAAVERAEIALEGACRAAQAAGQCRNWKTLYRWILHEAPRRKLPEFGDTLDAQAWKDVFAISIRNARPVTTR